ncbi:MAG TPA: response regulator transcription factor [Chthoniobacteraceae bacterium]|jgi:DNA-binding NarL/FixJ family response regulator|nr:response regulator transcription factor [Chthoniobacteraceae bacterium]
MPRILLADDHDIAREGVRALVASHPGWEVCGEARAGRDALRLAAELKPDVLVTDVLMPDLNGVDVARQIRKDLSATEIVILSGHEDDALIQQAFDAGVRAYVSKSEARVHLIPAIEALLARKPYLTVRVAEVLMRDYKGPAAGSADPLTAREREIVQLLAEGRSNKEISSTLDIGVKTVETHRASIMRKLNLNGLSDIVLYAIRHKIVEA